MDINHIKGLIAEYIVMVLYIIKGYRLIKHRYQSRFGEIDLIFRKGSRIVFCEVKWRNSEFALDGLLTLSQQRRIKNSAEHFLLSNSSSKFSAVRMDIALVRSIINIKLFKNWTM